MGLFGKAEPEFTIAPKSETVWIDVRENGFVINDKRLGIPSVISEFEAVLGKSRGVMFRTSEKDLELMRLVLHEDGSKRTNYAWDDLGMMCYTNNGTVVNTFAVIFNKPRVITDATPKYLFGGRFTVGGEDWYNVIPGGDDLGTSRHARVGDLILCASYLDCDRDNETDCPRDNFSGIEISLAK